MKLTVEEKYRIIIDNSCQCLLTRGFVRKNNDFYRKENNIGKLVSLQRDPQHKSMAVFTMHVGVFADEYWELAYPTQSAPEFPQLHQCILTQRLGKFYGKRRPDKWLTVDALTDPDTLIKEISQILDYVLFPFLDAINSLDDVFNKMKRGWVTKMRLLIRLGRREEAYAELTKLLALKHQGKARQMIIQIAQRDGLIE